MSFPPNVKAKAFIASGRCCCLCHKFCGVRIECHHIIPKTKGGKNSFDNCIPLCFDCHAEVEHYNPLHPKGNKFSPDELRGLRDAWFWSVRSTPSLQTAPATMEVDRKVFDALRSIIPSNGSIAYIRDHGFTLYKPRSLKQLKDFKQWAALPDSEFLDSDLESLRSLLNNSIRQLLLCLGTNTFFVHQDEMGIPADWEDRCPEVFHRAHDDSSRLAAEVCDVYDSLIRTGRRKLNVA